MQNKEIILSPSKLHAPKVVTVEQGLSIRQIIQRQGDISPCIVEINGNPLTVERWDYIPSPNDHVLISVPLMGGDGKKNPLRIILTIVVIIVAAWTGQWWAAKGYIGGSLGGAAAAAVVSTAGMLLVNAIAPIRYSMDSKQSYKDSPTYAINGGSNSANPWGVIPVNLGINRVYPPLGSGSYTEIVDEVVTKYHYIDPSQYNNAVAGAYVYGSPTYQEIVGSDEYLRMLVIWGHGPLKIDDLKIGETLLSSYSDVEVQTREGWSDDEPITLFPSAVHQESIGLILTSADGMVVRAAEPECDELSVDIALPNGLVEVNDDGSKTFRTVAVLIQYREVGAGLWTTHGTKTFIDTTTKAIRYGTRWTVDKTKAYEIGITRLTADSTDDYIVDEVYWMNLRSIVCDNPIQTPFPVAATALRIKATDQLNGVINTLNGIVSSYVDTWDGEAWTTGDANKTVANNPAALYRQVLMGTANAKARTASQLNDAELGEWYEFCATNGYAFNLYYDTKSSVWDTCSDIAVAGRASPIIKNGLWNVTVDTGTQTLVQHITPRNSWGLSSTKILFNPPHAFRIRFVNEENGYQWDERIVYDDGYTSANATLFESIEIAGITDPDLIWKFGRFHIAQARLRPEIYTLNMDFEHLVASRGDKVRVSHDVPLWGIASGRIKALTINEAETHFTHITLDESITMESGKTYVCRFRLADGSTLIQSIVLDAGETNTIELTTPLLIASGPAVGDLAMFGETDIETVELLIKSIRRSNDYVAELTLVDLASAIYTADTGVIPAFNPNMTTPIDVTKIEPDPPTIDSVATGIDVATTSGGGSISTIQVYLSAPQDHIKIRGYRVRYRLEGETQWQYTAEQNTLTIPVTNVSDQLTYEIQAQSISVYGIESQWTTVTTGASDLPQIVPPSATNISAALSSNGSEYDLRSIIVTFTPPSGGVYAYTEIYACNDNSSYKYVGRDSTGSFIFSGMGSIYKTGDTCYIKIRSVSNFGVREPLPATASASVVITATVKIASFYFGLYDQWAGNASISHADTKIVIGNLNGIPEIKLGPSADAITFAGNQTGIYQNGDGYFRAGGSSYGMTFNPVTGVLQADKVKVGSSTNYIDIDGGNSWIQSSNYVSGAMGAGFSLTPELLEVGNIAARGIIRTSVFQYDSISAHGGSRVLAHGADVLAADMTALDASTLTIAGNETWAVNDRLRIKEGTDDEWFVITSIAAAPTYAVTRDMDAQYTSNNNPVWKKGAAVVNYGQSGNGGIFETASETNAPYLSIFTHAGSPWDTISSLVRMGNLNGYAGYKSDVYGWAAYIDKNNYIKIDPVSGIDMSGKITLKSGSGVDWGYVSGTGKPSDYADVTNYTDTRVANALSENNVTTIRQPGGAAYSSSGNPDTGAIVITFPQSWSNTMVRFAIDVFLFQTTGNLSFTTMVGGYNHIPTNYWLNTFAQIIGSTTADNRVRFGHNGTKCCVVIGETTSTWHYPKINIRDFQAGHSNYAVSDWDDGWAISIANDLTGYTFTADIADALLDAKAIKNQGALATADTANWGTQVDGRPANLAAITGTENINNASITINANGTLTGAGSGQVTTTGIGAETPTAAQSKADAALTAAQNYADTYFVLESTHTDDLAALQSQIDGNITSWFYAYAPTTSNVPASSWTTDALKNQHLGDLFYDTVTGYAYRYLLSGTYQWQKLSDSDITAALSAASAAQDTADSKRRVFVATPTTPYDVGDLWDASGTVKRCSTERLSGAYVAEDWTTIANYTTNTNQLTDGSGLGTTATWTGVSGTGKPSDNADVTPPLPSDENQIAYWSFNDGSGLTAVDNSGHSLPGTITGATWADGKAGKALDFVPANVPGVNCGHNAALNVYNSPFTISMWIYDRAVSTSYPLAVGTYGGNYLGFMIGICAAGGGFRIGEGPSSIKYIPECSPDLNQWTHLVGTFDGTHMKGYKNGVQVGSAVDVTPASWAGQDFVIGRYSWAAYHGDGLLDEVRFYSEALPESEIKALYLNPSGNKSQTVNMDSITNGSYGKVLSTIIDAGYITLLRASATANQRITITATGVEQYTNNVKMIELASGSLYLGDQSNEHLKASSTGIEIKDGATVLTTIGATSHFGQVAAGKGNLYINGDGDIEGRVNTTVRWHLDSDGSGYIGESATNFYWGTDGIPHFNIAQVVGFGAGDITLANAATTSTAVTTGTPTKKKEILITVPGTYRTEFDLGAANGVPADTYYAYGRVYKNGTALGTTRSLLAPATSSWSTFNEDFTFVAGDLVQIYIWTNGYLNAYVRNFEIQSSFSLVPVVMMD